MPTIRTIVLLIVWNLTTLNFTSAQVTADFSVNDDSGCAPLAVSFFDESTTSTGSINSWIWEIDNVQFANVEEPNRLFETPGVYTICLTVTNTNGDSDEECKTNFISIFALPIADFTSSATEGCIPHEVFFTDNSNSPDGNITDWYWDLGGSCGVLSETNLTNTSCVYNDAGQFQITLIVEDDNGCVGIESREDFVTVNDNPVIDIDFDLIDNCDPPFQVNFTNNNPNANISYAWDFGNGSTSNQNAPQGVTYTTGGPFEIEVIATNDQTGCRDTFVIDQGIEAGFEMEMASDVPGGCGTLTLNLEGIGDNAVDSIRWNFGDGNSSTDFNPSYDYATFGCYTVVMTAYIQGCAIVDSEEICLLADGEDIAASLTLSNTSSCTIPFVVGFNVNTTQPVEWELDFGDGSTSNLSNPSHQYVDFGVFPVSLTLTNSAGCTRIIRDTVNVIETTAALPDIIYNGCAPQTITFVDESITASSIVSWNWTFIDPAGLPVVNSNFASPTFTATDIGCYDIILEVTDMQGCSSTETFIDKICLGTAPNISLVAAPLQACASQAITFEGITVDNADYWAWDFNEDGIFDEFDQNTAYEFRDTGCFDITLLAAEFGCETLITVPEYVCIDAPVARYNTLLDCELDLERTFNSVSFGADSVYWDFGIGGIDTDTSTMTPTTFTFPDTGEYNVMLITYNFLTGCTDTLRKDILITDPAAMFTIDETEFCLGETLEPVSNSVQANTYRWTTTGGSITGRTTPNPTITFNTPGEHSIQLVVEDVNECKDTTIFEPIFVNEIIPGFTADQNGDCLPILVNFQDTSTNLFAAINEWNWVVGDTLAVLNGQNPTFTSDTVGNIPVQLIVTDTWGCTATLDDLETLVINAPFASFAADTSSCPGVPIQFTNESFGQGLSYSWTFGDGEVSSDPNPEHLYQEGVFTTCLMVENADACQNETCIDITVAEVVAGIGIDDTYSICPPSTVDFFSTSQNAVNFEWEFGDNSGGSDAEDPSHIYIQEGLYDVGLVAFGANMQCSDTIQIDSLVELGVPDGTFSFTVDGTCVPTTVTFIGASNFPFDYTWFFDDGNSEISLNEMNDTVTYEYTTGSEIGFVPKLLLFDSENCDVLVISPDTIYLNSLEVDFSATDTFLCDGNNNVIFESMVDASGALDYVEWSFENGTPNNSDSDMVSVDFSEAGQHDISLLVRSGECEGFVEKENLIWIVDSISLAVNDTVACLGDTIQLYANTNAIDFIWTPSDYFVSADTVGSPYMVATEQITYEVEGTILTCTPAIDTALVQVNTLPEVQYTTVWSYFPGQTLQMDLDVISEGTFTYSWEPSMGLSCINCPNPSITPDTSMVLTATVTNLSTGCETTVEILLNQLTSCPEELVGIPNAFSPNQDGNNDEVELFSFAIEEIDVMRIYSRWGELMFESNDINMKWDGTYKGKMMEPGIYVYYMEAQCPIDDSILRKKGDILLMR